MKLRRGWPLALLCLALAACDLESSGEDDGKGGAGGGDTDGSVGGGAGGGAGGQGGGGGSVDGPCPSLNAQACAGREDCAPVNDVFGAFVECRDLDAVACSQLDEGRCGSRDDCAWDGDACGQQSTACAEHAAQAACEGAGCHWYDDACHEDEQVLPGRCDKPDEATCAATAGCAWGPQGCREDQGLPTCERLAEGACNARQDCRWNGRACEVDQAQLACAQLDMNACAVRNDCAWNGSACMARSAGRCDALDEGACQARADCEPVYGEPNDDCACDGGGAAERPAPPPPCEDPNGCAGDPIPQPCDCGGGGGFIGCQPRVVDCSLVPPEACEATPGCHLELGGGAPECPPPPPCECRPGDDCACAEPAPCDPPQGVCVNDGPADCGDRPIDQCAADGRCRVEQREVCDGGFGADGREVPDDADRIIIAPCQIEAVCVPAGGNGVCEAIRDADTCFRSPGCGWEQIPGCACDGRVPPPPDCGCAPDDPNCGCGFPIAPPACEDCFACVTVGGACENLSPDQCQNARGCHLEEFEVCGCEGGGAGFRAPPPNEDPPEGGGARPAPCFCEVQLVCVSDGQQVGCEIFDEAQCAEREDCRWMQFEGGGGAPGGGGAGGAGGGCVCPDGAPDCECDAPGVPFPGGFGQCVPAWVPLQCHELGVDNCGRNPECAVVEGPVPPCLPCDPEAQPDCPVCEPERLCVNVNDHCRALAGDACAADPLCFPREDEICFGGGAPECPPGVDCLIAPPPPDGECEVHTFCVPIRYACDQLPLDRCDEADGCLRLDGGIGCWSAEPDACWGLDLGRCGAHPECAIGPGGGLCGCFIDAAGNEVCECEEVDQCMPRDQAPRACMADRDCFEGEVCLNGVCSRGPIGGQCDEQRACPPNAICRNGECLLLE